MWSDCLSNRKKHESIGCGQKHEFVVCGRDFVRRVARCNERHGHSRSESVFNRHAECACTAGGVYATTHGLPALGVGGYRHHADSIKSDPKGERTPHKSRLRSTHAYCGDSVRIPYHRNRVCHHERRLDRRNLNLDRTPIFIPIHHVFIPNHFHFQTDFPSSRIQTLQLNPPQRALHLAAHGSISALGTSA